MTAGQEALLAAWQSSVDRAAELVDGNGRKVTFESVDAAGDDFPDDDQPIAVRVVSEREELVALRARVATERTAAASLVRDARRRAQRAEANLATAMRFILSDKARATAWVGSAWLNDGPLGGDK